MVREAFDGSVTWVRFCVNCHTSQVSTVPKASSPRSARSRAPGSVSSSQAILVPLKYGSMMRPVLARIVSSAPALASSAHSPAVRRSCHTIALCSGLPVWRSHSSVVSRWLVMPMAAMSRASMAILSKASRATVRCVARISQGSCSTQPGWGKIWRNSRCALETGVPFSSKRIARELVVP